MRVKKILSPFKIHSKGKKEKDDPPQSAKEMSFLPQLG